MSRWLSALRSPGVGAQSDYPNRPIRLVAPSPPAGVHDVVGRLWAERIKSLLGTIVVENRPGAGTLIGASEVVKAEPDGYTLLLGSTSSHIIAPVIAAHAPYDPLKDLATDRGDHRERTSIAVTPSLPGQDAAELIDYAKANPGKLSYGSAGVGSMSQMTGELFKQLAGGLDIVHVPYKGAGPGIADLISGHIPIADAERHRPGPRPAQERENPRARGECRRRASKARPRSRPPIEAGTAGHDGPVLLRPVRARRQRRGRSSIASTRRRSCVARRSFSGAADAARLSSRCSTRGRSSPNASSKTEQARWTPIVRASGAKLE